MLQIVETSNKKLQGRYNPIGPRGRCCKICPRSIYGSYRRDARLKLREDSFDLKLKVAVRFLRVKRDQRANSSSLPPPPTLFSPNTSDKSFEIAILLKIVQTSDQDFRVDTAPQGPGTGVVNYALGAYMVLLEVMLV